MGQGVKHLAVKALSDIACARLSEGMMVFWCGDRPIGDIIVREGRVEKSRIEHIDANFILEINVERETLVRPARSASVVICTRDRPAELQVCLSSLPQQTYPPGEIIVVDNASKDRRTREVALAAGVTYLREERPGLDIARNTGALRATGDIVAYTDDDVLLHPRWLERLVGAFDKPEIAAVTGLVLPAELETEAQRHFETYWGFNKGYKQKDIDAETFRSFRGRAFPAWDIGAGASMAFRREVFQNVGLFDERLDVGQAGCSGDSEYWYRLLAHGHTCRYVPSSVAFHFHRRTMEGLSNQIYYYMRGHAAALMVQHERTGIPANRLQAYYHLPRWYAGRLFRSVCAKTRADDLFLKEEIAGYLAGLRFYHTESRGK